MRKRLLWVVLALLMVAPGSVTAQDDAWTCDDGANDVLNAAQVAFEAGNFERALELATTAVSICTNNFQRFRDAVQLQERAEVELERLALERYVAAATPGRVDLGDYTLFMDCQGEGSPTVIFENGHGMTLDTWEAVFPVVAEQTRACVYDRLGIGLSDPLPPDAIRTTQDAVDDLHALLEASEIEGPYILVGHSIGGFNLRLFAAQYPDELAGLVYVDVATPDQGPRLAAADPSLDADGFPREQSPERLDYPASAGQVRNAATPESDFPVIVLTAENGPSSAALAVWQELHAELAALYPNSQHIFVEKAGHFIQQDDPDVVINAILQVLAAARAPEAG
jgi:pimeloyl-ACP methyl ester carboxylesterase